jgi:glutathione S-transferase
MPALRIFSYLPNPRIWKATIAGRLTGVEVEIRGARPDELKDWLWDFDARPLTPDDRADASLARAPRAGFKQTLYKTDAFLDAHPFGTVPAAFSPDGAIGVFESNSIMRAVARLAGPSSEIYGRSPYEASRIDSFLDAALVFARDAQLYLFALTDKTIDTAVHGRAAAAFAAFLGGVERALAPDRSFIVGDRLTLADICFAAELCLFSNERIRQAVLRETGLAPIIEPSLASQYPRATAHFAGLVRHPAFAPDMGPYLAKIEATGSGQDDRA